MNASGVDTMNGTDGTLSQSQWERADLSEGCDDEIMDVDGVSDSGMDGMKDGDDEHVGGEDDGGEEVEEVDEDGSSDEELQLSDHEDDTTLYCICRSRDDGRFMVSCDECKEWYHVDCINMPKSKVRFSSIFRSAPPLSFLLPNVPHLAFAILTLTLYHIGTENEILHMRTMSWH